MIKKFFAPLKLLLVFSLFFSVFSTKVDAAAPSSVDGWTFFVRIDEGGFGMGESGSFLLCLSQTECRIVSLSNIEDAVGAYTYSASGANGTVTMGSIVMTFSFTDDRRGTYGLVRGGSVGGGYQLGSFSAAGGTASAVTNSVLDFSGKRVDLPLSVNYRLVTGNNNTYYQLNGNVPSSTNLVAVTQLNGSTTRIFFNDAVLGTGHTHLMFITPTSGLFAYKIGDGKAYEKGTFTLQPTAAPAITRHPEDQVVEHGGRAVFSVEVTGTRPMTYQWFKDLNPIPGATQETYVVDPADNEGRFATGYYVSVSNVFGSAASTEALLETTCPTTLDKNFQWFPYTGGTTMVFATNSGCSLQHVPTENSWLSTRILPGVDGTTIVEVKALPNDNGAPRTGVPIQIGSKQFTVTQQGAPAPDNVKGTTLRLRGINDTNYSPFFYFTTLTGTNQFFAIRQDSGQLTNLFPYTYSRIDATNATFKNITNEYYLSFTDHWRGSFVYSNLALEGSSFTGTFTLSQSRLDENLDGHSELVWQHTDGRIQITSIFGTNAPPESETDTNRSHRVWGVEDLDGDSYFDFIHMDGQRRLTGYFTNLTLFKNGAPVPAAWRPTSVQDVSHDGQPDFLFQNQDRRVSYWQMAGTNFTSAVSVRNGKPAGANWLAVAVADMNLDRQLDIVFWNSTNNLAAVWLMNDGRFLDVQFLASQQTPGDSWRLRAVADMDYDGQNDLLWQDQTTGAVKIWHLEGLAKRTPPEGVESEDIDISDPPADPAWTLIGPK